MKIINRYVMREHVGPLVFSLTALTSLLLLNYIAKRFGDLVGKGLGWDVIGEFFMLSLPFTVAMTLPMAVLVSTLYAFSRLAAENEITALKASGISMTRVLLPVLFGASGLAAFMLFFNDQVLPRANHRLSTLQQDIARKKPTFALRSQVINEVSPGKLFLKADFINQATSVLHVVTIYDQSDPMRRRTIYADSGRMELAGDDLLLTLYDGSMHEIPKNDPTQLQRLFYDVDHVRVRSVVNSLTRSDSANTYKGDREMSVCEMQREFASHELDYQVAHYTLEQALVNVTRQLAAGVVPESPEATSAIPPSAGRAESSSQAPYTVVPKGFRPRRARTVGAVYCDMLARLSDVKLPGLVKIASAAQPALRLQAQQPPQKGAAQSPQSQRTVQQPATPPQPSVAQDTAQRRPPPRRIIMGGSAAPIPRPVPTPVPAAPGGASAGDSAAVAGGASGGAPIVPGAVPAVTAPSSSALSTSFDPGGAIDAARSRMLENRTTMNRYGVEIQKKFALSAACIVFVLIGAPIALRFPRGGVGLVIGVSLVVFAIYYIGLIAGESLADRALLTPFWAMWAANVIFTAVGILLMVRMGREGATSRGGDVTELVESLRTFVSRIGRRFGLPLERRHHGAA